MAITPVKTVCDLIRKKKKSYHNVKTINFGHIYLSMAKSVVCVKSSMFKLSDWSFVSIFAPLTFKCLLVVKRWRYWKVKNFFTVQQFFIEKILKLKNSVSRNKPAQKKIFLWSYFSIKKEFFQHYKGRSVSKRIRKIGWHF